MFRNRNGLLAPEFGALPTSQSIAPHGPEQDTYLLLDNFGGRLGRAWRETDEEATDRETLIPGSRTPFSV